MKMRNVLYDDDNRNIDDDKEFVPEEVKDTWYCSALQRSGRGCRTFGGTGAEEERHSEMCTLVQDGGYAMQRNVHCSAEWRRLSRLQLTAVWALLHQPSLH